MVSSVDKSHKKQIWENKNSLLSQSCRILEVKDEVSPLLVMVYYYSNRNHNWDTEHLPYSFDQFLRLTFLCLPLTLLSAALLRVTSLFWLPHWLSHLIIDVYIRLVFSTYFLQICFIFLVHFLIFSYCYFVNFNGYFWSHKIPAKIWHRITFNLFVAMENRRLVRHCI